MRYRDNVGGNRQYPCVVMASECYHFQTRLESSSSSSHINLASGNRVGIGDEGSARACDECTKVSAYA